MKSRNPEDSGPLPGPDREGDEPARVAPVFSRTASGHPGKVGIFFGPPLAILTAEQKNTMEISGKLNRTAERYMEILRHHGIDLSVPEQACLSHICHIGFMSPLEISELADEVRLTAFQCEGLDKEALTAKLESASFADLVAVVESLGF